jgi:hypothetical protein
MYIYTKIKNLKKKKTFDENNLDPKYILMWEMLLDLQVL